MAVVTVQSAFLQTSTNDRIVVSITAGRWTQTQRGVLWHNDMTEIVTSGSLTTSDGKVHKLGGTIRVTNSNG